MARTTALVIIILAIIAALVTGIQIGRKAGSGSLLATSPSPILVSTTPSAEIISKTFQSETCGVEFDYDSTYQLTESSNSAILINPTSGDKISMACATEVPLPPLSADRIEEATITGQPAVLYHDASAKDGSPVDVYVFTHPTNQLQVALLGFGEAFEKLLNTLRVISF